jgi:hypothetical protein
MLNKLKKKIKTIMNGFDMETLIAIKSSFQANKFQWIKTNDRNKLGKVVEVRDVVPGRNGRFLAILSDGSQLDTDDVSSCLMMLADDQPPMSLAEVQSINYIPSLSEEMKIAPEIPADFVAELKSQPVAQAQAIQGGQPAQIAQPQVKQQVSVDPVDIFGMFSLEDTELNLSVKIKLPSKSLLKMMYTNSKNKEEFLTKLSNYINNNVTVDAIKKTMKKALTGRSEKTTKDNA